MNHPFTQMLIRWCILALGVVIATKLINGIYVENGTALLVVVLLLSFFNAILKPILVLFTLPFILVTMGLGVVVINALLFMFVGRIVEGFEVAGFWSAVGGSLVVSITNFIASRFVRPTPTSTASTATAQSRTSIPRSKKKPDDVIDI